VHTFKGQYCLSSCVFYNVSSY